MHSEARKIQGKQWYITLPQDWRDQHKLKRGDALEIMYGDSSVFIANPGGRKMSPLEQSLIEFIVALPSISEGQKIAEKLKEILAVMETDAS
jgi:bifunctional DNA-binding transcriptional regulator/antitoxin component of YhaV-PrlF toxin-antitoxin module